MPDDPQTAFGGGKRALPSPSDVLFSPVHSPPAAGGILNVFEACNNNDLNIEIFRVF